jgi:glucose-6-phosphate dehydrogenase assembly protein OpcA
MAQSIEEKNEALVNKAFDTLSHKRDYEAAERLWSPGNIRHCANIGAQWYVQLDQEHSRYAEI